MTTVGAARPAAPRREHASRDEYFAWLHGALAGSRGAIRMRHYFYEKK